MRTPRRHRRAVTGDSSHADRLAGIIASQRHPEIQRRFDCDHGTPAAHCYRGVEAIQSERSVRRIDATRGCWDVRLMEIRQDVNDVPIHSQIAIALPTGNPSSFGMSPVPFLLQAFAARVLAANRE